MEKIYGYIRVSSKDQNEDRQRIAMREFGVPDNCLIMDKQSGKDFDRPGYKKLLRELKPGDTLGIKSIDRLGRNYDEILEQWRVPATLSSDELKFSSEKAKAPFPTRKKEAALNRIYFQSCQIIVNKSALLHFFAEKILIALIYILLIRRFEISSSSSMAGYLLPDFPDESLHIRPCCW